MRSKTTDHDRIAIVLFILFACVMSWQSLELGFGSLYRPGPGLFPFFSALGIGILSLTYLILKTFGRSRSALRLRLGPHWRKAFYLMIITFLYILVFWNPLGYLISTFIWLWAVFWIAGMRSWKKNIAVPMAITIVSYFFLVKVVHCYLPMGILKL